MMIVGAGKFRNKRLKSPPPEIARPTKSLVRAAIFNVLSVHVNFPDFTFIDAFGGSGIMGIEAFSRGFASARITEKNPTAYRVLIENIRNINHSGKIQSIRSDFFVVLDDLISGLDKVIFFIDPPYSEEKLIWQTLDRLSLLKHPSKQFLIVIETGHELDETSIKQWEIFQHKKYGKTRLSFLH